MTPLLFADNASDTPQIIAGILFITASVIVAQLGLYLFNKWMRRQRFTTSNDVTGIVFGAISLIYSLILTFVIVAVWDDYNQLDKTIKQEADKINSILAHTSALQPEVKMKFDTAIYSYCAQVVNSEWQMKDRNEAMQPSAIPCLRRLILTTEPRTKIEDNIYAVVDEDLSSISDLRRERLSHNHSQIPAMVWNILDVGGVMMIVFFYFFQGFAEKLKRIYLAFLVVCVSMCMYLAYTLDHPFNGNSTISNAPYRNIITEISTNYNMQTTGAH